MNTPNNLHDDSVPFGVYVAIRLNKEDKESVLEFCQKDLGINMANRESPYEKRMHATLLYAQDPKNKTPEDIKANLIEREFVATASHWEIFTSHNTGQKCLVLKLHCPEIQAFHNQLKDETGLSHSFGSYIPHISIHYNYEGDIPEKLPPIQIRLKEMYVKPLYYSKPVAVKNAEPEKDHTATAGTPALNKKAIGDNIASLRQLNNALQNMNSCTSMR